MTSFMEKLQAKWNEGKFVCVGLDSDLTHKKFPAVVPPHDWAFPRWSELGDAELQQLKFNCHIVDATKDLVLAYKPNLAFYGGSRGKFVLWLTIRYIREVAPDVVIILDAKQGDIGNTNDGYVDEDFEYYDADAVTVHPTLGKEAMKPFLDRSDKGIIVLCKTSNEGADEFQDLPVPSPDGNGTVPLHQRVAYNVSREWNYNGNCALVVGATYPKDLANVRHIVGDMPILIPGIGDQNGKPEEVVAAGKTRSGKGMIINASRSIIFAYATMKEDMSGKPVYSSEQFAEAARDETQELHDTITATLAAA